MLIDMQLEPTLLLESNTNTSGASILDITILQVLIGVNFIAIVPLDSENLNNWFLPVHLHCITLCFLIRIIVWLLFALLSVLSGMFSITLVL